MIFLASGSILAEEIRFRRGCLGLFFSYLGWAWGGLLGKSSSGILNSLFGDSLDESDNGFIVSHVSRFDVYLNKKTVFEFSSLAWRKLQFLL